MSDKTSTLPQSSDIVSNHLPNENLDNNLDNQIMDYIAELHAKIVPKDNNKANNQESENNVIVASETNRQDILSLLADILQQVDNNRHNKVDKKDRIISKQKEMLRLSYLNNKISRILQIKKADWQIQEVFKEIMAILKSEVMADEFALRWNDVNCDNNLINVVSDDNNQHPSIYLDEKENRQSQALESILDDCDNEIDLSRVFHKNERMFYFTSSSDNANEHVAILPINGPENRLVGELSFYFKDKTPDELKNIEDDCKRIYKLFSAYDDQFLFNLLLTEKMERLALVDIVTGLGNTMAGEQRINKEIDKANKYKANLAFFGLKINNLTDFDNHKKEVLLNEIGQILRLNLRGSDASFHYGDGDFLIILPDTDAPRAKVAAERINVKVNNLESPELANDKVLHSMTVVPLSQSVSNYLRVKEVIDYGLEQSKKSDIPVSIVYDNND